MGHMERAWTALMAGDMAQAVAETQYVDGPNRMLGGIARLTAEEFGSGARAWLDLPNPKMGAISPRQFLKFDDIGTWYAVSRMLSRPVDMEGVDYSPTPKSNP